MKRFQIPVDDAENQLFQRAAEAHGEAAAVWARNLLTRAAEKTLAGGAISPKRAVENLRQLNAPTAEIEQMIRESVEGRYGDLP